MNVFTCVGYSHKKKAIWHLPPLSDMTVATLGALPLEPRALRALESPTLKQWKVPPPQNEIPDPPLF
jgi:hypothetical protein